MAPDRRTARALDLFTIKLCRLSRATLNLSRANGGYNATGRVSRSAPANALDRLAYVGQNGIGALSYEPEHSKIADDDRPLALDRLAEESAIMLAGESEEVFEELLRLCGSSSGARPKIVAQVSAD